MPKTNPCAVFCCCHSKLLCFFLPCFATQDIPYLYVDPNLPHRNVARNVASDFVLPLPLGVVDWNILQANVSKVQNARSGRVDVFEHDERNCFFGVVVVVV